jgi:hypothetical protein
MLALLAISGAAAPGLAAAKVKLVRGLVASPRSGSHPGSPVRVVLRVGDRYPPGAVLVRLNGQDISSYFRVVRHGRRVSEVSPSQGIRYGRNTLTVTVVPQHEPRRRRRVRFTVSRRVPLAGAGPDVRVLIGSRVTLDGSRSLTPGRVVGAEPGRSTLHVRWRLMSRPRGSHARLHGRTQATSPLLTLRRSMAGAAHPVLRPDRIGRYTVRLTVGNGQTSQSDLATVQAAYASSEVPIDTAVDGKSASGATVQGIAIGYHPAQHGYRQPNTAAGEQFYPLGSGHAAQIVIVNRQTLAPVSSSSYPAGQTFVQQAKTALSGLPSTELAIVTTWPSPAWAVAGQTNGNGLIAQQLTAAKGPLGSIGASPITAVDAANGMAMEDSTLSWMGVQGFPAGSDWERIGGGNYGSGGPSGSTGAGLNGFLAYDPADNYTYVAKAGVPFDLGPDSPTTATMTAGPATYSAALPAGSMGGFAVVVLHAATLAPYSYSDPSGPGSTTPLVFSTRNSDGSANYGPSGATFNGQGGFPGMSAYLDRIQYDNVGEPLIVLIRSIGAPFPEQGLQPENNYQGTYDPVLAAAIDRLAFDVASLGGHYEWLIRMATIPTVNAHQSYSEVGRNHTSEGDVTVADTGSGMTPAPSSTELSGRLERNNLSLFAPVQTANGAAMPNPLASLVTSEPVAWPDTSGGPALAVKCLGEAVLLGSDPRFQYWNLVTQASDWSGYQETLAPVTLAAAQREQGCLTLTAQLGASPKAASKAFGLVKAELNSEFGWMGKLESYVSNLSAPFGYSGTAPVFTAVNTATQAVEGALPLPPENPASLNGFSIADSILGIAGEILGAADFEVSAPVVGVTGYVFGLWGEFSGDTNDSATATFAQRNTVEAAGAKIGGAVADRLQAVSGGSVAMTDAIASDYARLKTVGTYAGCVPDNPPNASCPVGWDLTRAASTATKDAFILSARRAAWAGLLSAAWPTVLYTNSNPGSYHGDFNGAQEQISSIECGFSPPFAYSGDTPLQSGQAFLRYDFRSDPASSEGSNTKFMVITNGNLRGASPNFSFPPASLFTDNQLFSPVDSEDISNGPLGIDEYQLLVDNWHSGTTSSPSRQDWVGC